MRRSWVPVVCGSAILLGATAASSWAGVRRDVMRLRAAESTIASGAFRVSPTSSWRANGVDPWDVFVCDVPANSEAAAFGDLPLRLPLDERLIADMLNARVTDYFVTLSHGMYRPVFAAAQTVRIGADDEPQACVELALSQASSTARGVLVVATAEQAADQPGGYASMGDECATPPCLASESRRAVYVGASDFHPQWGEHPPMDLIEHELGHALGWPHSGYDETLPVPHRSALDVMSDSAAPRAVDRERRDAPDTLAINRVIAGWLPVRDVAVMSPTAGAADVVQLQPSTGETEMRLAVVPLGRERFLTLEWLSASGLNSHLPHAGLAVHLIEGAGAQRVQTPLVGSSPFAALLAAGDSLDTNGVRIEVAGVGEVRVTLP